MSAVTTSASFIYTIPLTFLIVISSPLIALIFISPFISEEVIFFEKTCLPKMFTSFSLFSSLNRP